MASKKKETVAAVREMKPAEEPGVKISKFAVVRDGVKLRRALNEALDNLPHPSTLIPGRTKITLETLEDGQTRVEWEAAYRPAERGSRRAAD